MAVKGKRADSVPDPVGGELPEDVEEAPEEIEDDSDSGSSASLPGNVEMLTLTEDIFGNPYLPGQEVIVIKELFEAAQVYEMDKAEHGRLTKRLTEEKKTLAGLTRKYREFFERTSDAMHFSYNCAGTSVVVDRNEDVYTKAESSGSKPDKPRGRKKKEAVEEIY